MKRFLAAEVNRVLAILDLRLSRRSAFECTLQAAAERDAVQAALGRMTAERDGYQGAYDLTLRALGEARTALHRLGVERDGYKGAYDQLQQELGAVRAKLENVISERDGFSEAVERMSRELGMIRAELDAMTEQRDAFGPVDQAACAESDKAALERMTAERDGYRGAYDLTLRALGEARTGLHGLGVERDGYRSAYDQLQKELGEVKAALHNMTVERDGFREASTTFSRDLGDVCAELHNMTVERDGFREASTTFSRDLGDVRAELHNMTVERDGFREASTTFSRDLGDVRAGLYNMTMERDGFKRAYGIVGTRAHLELDPGSDAVEPTDSASPAAKLPGILVLSLPKSGTVYINGLLTSGLGVPSCPVSLGYFPSDTLILGRLRRLARGGLVSSEHSDPSSLNLWALAAYLKRWVVHVRDPRSVALSWAHHVDRHAAAIDDELRDEIYGAGYPGLSFGEKLSVMIERFLPQAVTWVDDWLRVIDSRKYPILLTTFDQLADNEEMLVERILEFFGIPASCYRAPQLERTIDASNFRTGQRDEWRTSFTASQLARANELIGDRLLNRFGWLTR